MLFTHQNYIERRDLSRNDELRTKKGCSSLPSTALVTILCVVGSIIITIFLVGIDTIFASYSSQMQGMMGQHMGMQNMSTMMGDQMSMMGQHMGMQNMTNHMPGMMGQHMGMQNMLAMMGKNMDMHNMSAMMGQHMMFMQNMMTLLGKNMTAMQNMMVIMAKQMTGIEKLMTLMAKNMGMKNITTIQGRPVSEHQASAQSRIVSIVKGASDPSSAEPYNPSPLSVPVGTTVGWINNDNTGHTVTEGNPSGNTPPNGFDSGILAPGQTFTHTFDTPGTIQYYCTLHPTMMGEVLVK
jgi:plastocyanin